MRFGALALTLVLSGPGLAGCREVPVELRPDELLREQLGLTDRDAVHVVRVRVEGVSEVAQPDRVEIAPDAWVSFQGADTRGHVVRFDTASMEATAVEWLRQSDQLESPPLLTPASRWVVSFAGAPEALYPFAVEGSGELGLGSVQVQTERE